MGLKGKPAGAKPPSGKYNGGSGSQGKVSAGIRSELSNVNKSSPYTSKAFLETSKRTKSATISRSQSLGPTTQKASLLHRKSSDPDPEMSNKVQLRSLSASKTHQQRLSLSRTSRISTDSDQSSDKNYPIVTSQSAGNLSKKDPVNKKRRPFSFSTDYKDDQQPFVTSPVGDVKGFQINRSSLNPPLKRQQSIGTRLESRPVNHVQFADLRASSIELEIAEQPEAYLEDTNDGRVDEDISSVINKGNTTPSSSNLNDVRIFEDWKRGFENEVRNESKAKELLNLSKLIPPDHQKSSMESKSKPSTASTRDELMIARTDDLIMEVAKFIKQIKSSRTENFPMDMDLIDHQEQDDVDDGDANHSRHFSSSFGSVDGLSSMTCPSIINQSGQSTFRNKSGFEDLIVSRPASATLRKSLSNDDIHGRISLTLRMIEQEEKRDLMKKAPTHDHLQELVNRIPSSRPGSFLPSVSNPPSRPPSRSSYTSMAPPHISTPRTSDNDTSPRLPKIDSAIGHSEHIPSARSGSCYVDPFRLNSRGSDRLEIEDLSQQHFQHERNCNQEQLCQQEKNCQQEENLFHKQEHHYHQQEEQHYQKQDPINFHQNYQSEQPYRPEHTVHQNYSKQNTQGEPEGPMSATDSMWETSHEKTKKIFSFLDEVERSDRETLFVLKYDLPATATNPDLRNFKYEGVIAAPGNVTKSDLSALKTMDSLIRKGSVELAREQIILDRKLEESQYRIRVLEETLLHQRELNMRNLRNSEKDLKKRLNLQKEEFDLAFSRNEALINEMAAEKRILQERCDKVMKNFDENVEKYKDQIKSLQQKHLDEIKRLRKAQLNAENVRKQQWVGNKTQEIREMTVKGLEPEVQRIIQRHQQEMSEMRAWHSDEIRETEERYQRKMNMQLQDLREKFALELEEVITREKESANKRLESELKQREDEFETQKRRLTNDLYEERERVACEEIKWKDLMQENVRKVQVKGEIQIENLKQEYETKINNLERKHENELKSLKDIHEVERDSLVGNSEKKYDQAMKDRELQVTEAMRIEMDKELREREKRLREEFEKTRKEDEEIYEARNKRIQDKLQTELTEMYQTEKDLKAKLTLFRSDQISLEEQVFSLKTSLNLKDKQNNELQDSNFKMLEERTNLTSVIRREFSSQIEFLEDEVRSMKATFVEVEAKHKLELDQRQSEIDKVSQEKDVEIDKIGVRVKQAVSRKEETIQELQKQLDKANFQTLHLEGLIEQQRKDFLQSMTSSIGSGGGKRK